MYFTESPPPPIIRPRASSRKFRNWQNSITGSVCCFIASASSPSRCSSSKALAFSGSVKFASKRRIITGISAAIFSGSSLSFSASLTILSKRKITRRRATPPARSVNIIGLLLVASTTALITAVKRFSYFGFISTGSPPVIFLMPVPSPVYFGWSARTIRRLPTTCARPPASSSDVISALTVFCFPARRLAMCVNVLLPLPPSPVASINICQSYRFAIIMYSAAHIRIILRGSFPAACSSHL
ncbi:hypothetical protein BvCmsKKP064_02750 [Escherichia coli]|nr:hypothetical protein BvCmsKKP064_02750 [Escherichia coli]